MRVQSVPVDGLRARQSIEILLGRGVTNDTEAHAADRAERFAGGTGHRTVELRLSHEHSFLNWGMVRMAAPGGLEFRWRVAMMEGQ